MSEQEYMDACDLALVRAMKKLARDINRPTEHLGRALRSLETDLENRVRIEEGQG